MKKVLILTICGLGLPVLAAAQTPEQQIQAALTRAQEHGIPVSLLQTKIAEGTAKGASMTRIAAAVAAREAGLEKAQAALGRGDDEQLTTDELSNGADALGMGVSEAVLAKLAETARGDRREVAVAALTQLVAAGVAPQRALDQVTDALSHGADALANLPAQAAAARANHGKPSTLGRPANAGPPAGVTAPGLSPEFGKPSSVPTSRRGRGRH